MERIGLGTHLLVLAGLLVNLWVGGAYVGAWAGHLARSAFEAVLIAGYLLLVLRLGRGSEGS
jgi:hypothetical protein